MFVHELNHITRSDYENENYLLDHHWHSFSYDAL